MSQRYIATFLQKNSPQHEVLNSYRDKFIAQLLYHLNTAIQNAGLLPLVHAKHAIVAIYKIISGSYLHISSGRGNCLYIATMQTSEMQIRLKAMPPPNTNPIELDHVRVHVSNPFSRLSTVQQAWTVEKVHGTGPARGKRLLISCEPSSRQGSSEAPREESN